MYRPYMGRFLFLILLTSCASLFTSKEKLQEINFEDFEKFCVTAEGTGRFKAFKENHQFNFTSLVEEDYWLMGFRFPLHGEEVLKLDLKKVGAFEGDFYLRLRDAFYNFNNETKKYKLEDFNHFLKTLAHFINSVATNKNFLSQCKLSKDKTICNYDFQGYSYLITKNAEGYLIKELINQEFEILLEFHDLKKDFYQNNKMILRPKSFWQKRNEIILEISNIDCIRS